MASVVNELDFRKLETFPSLHSSEWVDLNLMSGKSVYFYSRKAIKTSIENEKALSKIKSRLKFGRSKAIEHNEVVSGLEYVGNKADIDCEVIQEGLYKGGCGSSAYSRTKIKFSSIKTCLKDANDRDIHICAITGNSFVIYQRYGDATMFADFRFDKPQWVSDEDIEIHNKINDLRYAQRNNF